MPDLRWREVEPPPDINGELRQLLEAVDGLKEVWERFNSELPADAVLAARDRTLRRHAIETGIIERLYDLEWGITETLVAEGLTEEVAARHGGVTPETLAIIRGQYDGLTLLADVVRGIRPFTVHFIRELHQIITGHQKTYHATDPLGGPVEAPLRHGEWKLLPNHVRRADGSLLEYAPPEQVQPQMERLLDEYDKADGAHALVRTAWLHHGFIRIHPFEDGNGRVARALTLLVLLQARYAPLVVDRRQREPYINALDIANGGDLRPLVRFFAALETNALRAELRPVSGPPLGAAVAVARAYVERLLDRQRARTAELTNRTESLAAEVVRRLEEWLHHERDDLVQAFRDLDESAYGSVFSAQPPDDRARSWRGQLITAARAVDFYTNLRDGSWWTRLHLTLLGLTLRYIVAVQKVGHGDTGVLAVTAYAERLDPGGDESTLGEATSLLDLGPDDSVTLVYTDGPADRWPEIKEFAERMLAAAVAEFSAGLG